VVGQHLPPDPLFLTLYKELYYRHIYAKLTPTLEQRFESYENYCDLFNYILSMCRQGLDSLHKGLPLCPSAPTSHGRWFCF
jgi:hypothetical protein